MKLTGSCNVEVMPVTATITAVKLDDDLGWVPLKFKPERIEFSADAVTFLLHNGIRSGKPLLGEITIRKGTLVMWEMQNGNTQANAR